jgi:predicted site-specific integrase-resolvase
MVVGYIRVSTDKQNLENQKHKILTYAHDNKLTIDEFVEIEISSKGDQKKRKIDELFSKQIDVTSIGNLIYIGNMNLQVYYIKM